MCLRPCRLPLWPRWACRCCWAPDPCSGTAASCPAAVAPAPAAAAATPGTPAPAAAASAAARPAAAPRSASSCTPTQNRETSGEHRSNCRDKNNKDHKVLKQTGSCAFFQTSAQHGLCAHEQRETFILL